MIDVAKHDKYSLGDVVAFFDPENLPGMQFQGRVLSMWKEKKGDEFCNFTLSILRRPFVDKAKDYISAKHLIYEYWDTNEYVTVKEENIYKVIASITIAEKEFTVDYFEDILADDDLKAGCIRVSNYHDNEEEALFPEVEPELILKGYHFDFDAEDYGDFTGWNAAFLLKVKEVVFDHFVPTLSKEAVNKNTPLWNFLLSCRHSDVPILDQVKKTSLLKTNRMWHPSVSLPLSFSLLQRFFAMRDDSVGVWMEQFEKWEEEEVQEGLKAISKLERENIPDPIYATEVEWVDDSSMSSFIVKASSDTEEEEQEEVRNPFSEEEEETLDSSDCTDTESDYTDSSSSVGSYVRHLKRRKM